MTTIEDFIQVREPLFSEHPESHPDYPQEKKVFLDHQTEETRQAMRDMAEFLTKWNSVKDSLPEFNTYVLLKNESGVISIGYLDSLKYPTKTERRWVMQHGGFVALDEKLYTEWRQIEFK